MATEIRVVRNWTASQTCTVVLREGFTYMRCNGIDGVLRIGQTITLNEGDRIVSLLGCTIEVEDIEGGQD